MATREGNVAAGNPLVSNTRSRQPPENLQFF